LPYHRRFDGAIEEREQQQQKWLEIEPEAAGLPYSQQLYPKSTSTFSFLLRVGRKNNNFPRRAVNAVCFD
jgi:hypothetical protein